MVSVIDQRQGRNNYGPWSIYVGTMINQKLDDLHIATCTCRMKRKHAVEDRVDWLAMVKSIFDEPNISCCCSRM